MNSKETPQNIERLVPMFRPPYLYGWPLLVGLGLHIIFPLPLFPQEFFSVRLLIGIAFVLAGILLIVWAVKTLLKSNVDPRFKPVGGIVSNGPFGYTRNPMYLSFTLIYLGILVVFNALWPLLFLPVVIAVLHYGVIKREERYLTARFGEAYKNYCARVRRWL